MGRPAYQITTSDFEAAHAYLMRHHYAGKPWLKNINDPADLQQFCHDELKPEEWQRLKSTILQERKRGKDQVKKTTPKTIQISPRAWKELNTLQCNLKDAGVDATYSDIIKAMAEKLNGKSAKQALKELEMQKDLF